MLFRSCHALSVPTALLVADSARVEEWHEVDTGVMADQARQVLEDMPVAAVKIGAIASIEQAAAIAEIVSDYAEVPLIVDPFLSSLPDAGMSDEDTVLAIRQILAPQATVLMLSQSELGRMAETWREPGADSNLEADVDFMHVFDARAVGHQQGGGDGEGVTAMGGEGGEVCLHTQSADGVGNAESENQRRRLVLHDG